MPEIVISKEELEQYGRTLAFNIWLHCQCGKEYDQEKAGNMITSALSFYVNRAYTKT